MDQVCQYWVKNHKRILFEKKKTCRISLPIVEIQTSIYIDSIIAVVCAYFIHTLVT